jgi:hypothetical protein
MGGGRPEGLGFRARRCFAVMTVEIVTACMIHSAGHQHPVHQLQSEMASLPLYIYRPRSIGPSYVPPRVGYPPFCKSHTHPHHLLIHATCAHTLRHF